MTEEEAFNIIRNVIRLENIAKDIARLSTQELKRVIDRVKAIIEAMPEGSIERELAYKQIQTVIKDLYSEPAKQLSDDVAQKLPEEALYQAEWGAKYIKTAPGQINQLQAAALAAVKDTRVLNKAVNQIAEPLSAAQWKRVDKVVRTGFLGGLTNQQIADEIGQTYKASKAELRAISRTAVMSMAQESHNQIWDANDEVIEGWVWDATMDYRVCPVCAPLDGKETKNRSDLPEAPAHPNCRCMILPITAGEMVRRERGQSPRQSGDRSYVELREKKPEASENVRVYKKKVRGPDGNMYYRVVTDVKPENGKALTMAGFLRRANNVTQESVLGKGRAKRFRDLIKGTPGSKAPLSPEEALIRVTK